MVVWFILPIIEPPQLTLFNSVLDWVVAIMIVLFKHILKYKYYFFIGECEGDISMLVLNLKQSGINIDIKFSINSVS